MSYAQFASIDASDFNTLAGGNPTTTSGTLNAVWATGGGTAGYGQTAVANVAKTVMFTERYHQRGAFPTYWYGANSGWMWLGQVDAPDCYTVPDVWCGAGWGTDGTLAPLQETEGKLTGGVAFRASGRTPVTHTDTHVSKQAPGQLAAGTNWTRTIDPGSVIVTNQQAYLFMSNNFYMYYILILLFSFLMIGEFQLFGLKFKQYTWKGNEPKILFLLVCISLVLWLGISGLSLCIVLYIITSLTAKKYFI
jgi:hypothetical protein